ncbi:hypothetical protein [Streptomyces sp. NPDC058657]|uniref:hypothetical protein n=1 Tax=unclassified Streptomyces TaxID=2593676 RepID=UPI00365B8114
MRRMWADGRVAAGVTGVLLALLLGAAPSGLAVPSAVPGAAAPWAAVPGAAAPWAAVPGAAAAPAAAAEPVVTLSKGEAGKGGEITVKGSSWRPGALLMLLICGESSPDTGVIGGTNSCANAEGRAVTTDAKGAFSRKLPVAEPPKPCPCVVHVATVTGRQASRDAAFKVAGHPVAPLPEPPRDTGRLAVTGRTVRLDGSSTLLTWFGAPEARRIVLRLGNLGSAPVTDPVFQVGTSHGVFAPVWEERQWRGTLAPGKQAEVALDVRLPAGAHGDYLVSVKYGTKVLAAQPWGVDRPWGVVLFWVLLGIVVPAGLFRIGMAVVDRVRPGALRIRGRSAPAGPAGAAGPDAGPGVSPDAVPGAGTGAGPDEGPDACPGPGTGAGPDEGPDAGPGPDTDAGPDEDAAGAPAAALPLPWFTPDSTPAPPPAPAPPALPHKNPRAAHAPVSAPEPHRGTRPPAPGSTA